MKRLFIFLLTILLSQLLNAKGAVVKNNPYSTTATLQGVIWWDKNLNGIQDETNKGIAGIRVHLYKNGVDTGEMVLTQTPGVGSYEFKNLEPNAKYTIKVDLPKNYPDFTLQNKGSDNNKDSDIVNWVWRSETVYLKAGDVGKLDAGLVCKYCAQMHLEKYTNNVLVQTPNDIPKIKVGDKVTWKYIVYNDSTSLTISNIKVTDNKEGDISCPKTSLNPGESMECFKDGIAKEGLYSNIGKVTGSTPDKNITDEYPSNYFGKLPKINIEKHTNGKDSDTAPGESLSIGEKVTWEYIVKNIGNVKLKDIQVIDNKEGNINCPKDELDVNESMTCTKIGVVKEGEYENEATVTAKDDDGDDTSDTDKSHYKGVTACLGNYMWLDSNLNGVQDSSEPGVVNIKVDLYDDKGNHLATTKTDSQGKYEFCGLKAGKYRVKFDQPPTYLFTPKDKGSDIRDSDVDNSGWSHIVDLSAGEKDMSIDAGIYCECDDHLVHPENYKELKADMSPTAALVLVLFLIVATSTLKAIKK